MSEKTITELWGGRLPFKKILRLSQFSLRLQVCIQCHLLELSAIKKKLYFPKGLPVSTMSVPDHMFLVFIVLKSSFGKAVWC